MTQLADAKHREVLVDVFLPSMDQGRLMGALEKGIQVCDLGCGIGLAVCLMHCLPVGLVDGGAGLGMMWG